MLPVASHRLCLFPSDKWPQNATHNATVRDALELWSRLFDRQDMTLIHAFRFDMPLREIEEWRLKNPLQSDALGRTTAASLDQYNLLHPVVQEAMLNVVREHVQRDLLWDDDDTSSDYLPSDSDDAGEDEGST